MSVFTRVLAEQIQFLTAEHKAFQTNESGILQSLANKAWQGENERSLSSIQTLAIVWHLHHSWQSQKPLVCTVWEMRKINKGSRIRLSYGDATTASVLTWSLYAIRLVSQFLLNEFRLILQDPLQVPDSNDSFVTLCKLYKS